MFCEHCHGRAANVHLVRIINGKKSENECKSVTVVIEDRAFQC